ncbi:MAG: hypothetical protein AUI14_06375 [Actinobacteria bacterium 13_2_20CM_2_71_6]|nr:MAG: hypothetical protein AUI14_06375 [Actinobacteria bacterium 13_2_20CM_2_71_6]
MPQRGDTVLAADGEQVAVVVEDGAGDAGVVVGLGDDGSPGRSQTLTVPSWVVDTRVRPSGVGRTLMTCVGCMVRRCWYRW